ncbi:MAG: metal-dependent phosphoesterase [Clostridiales bacterium]|jgi:predicted metal-dependent phosphoesterase TrpH|nr:metal-dependent phosphoesterase [Clostridiales bacterium]
MIDLHIHTTSSDGSEEPKDILIKAQQIELKYISITDHDSIGAYKKLADINVKSYFKGKIIPGCEFSVVHNGKPIEVLGYGIDLEAIKSTGILSDEKFFERENGYIKRMKEVCRNLNIKYTENLSIKGDKYFAAQIMHADLRKYPENEKDFPKEIWESLNVFYRNCVNNETSPFFLNQTKDYPTVQEIANLIKKSGGKSFLAHLYGYIVDDHEEFLNSITSLNALDGLECYHSLHGMDKTNYLLNYCSQHKLYASGGSDYHGKLKPTVNMGESISGVKIPFEILEPWLSDI